MDHKQLATPSGRRRGVFYPNRNSCSIIGRRRKARFKQRLPYASDAGEGPSQHSLQTSPSTPLFSRIGFVFAPRGTTTFARPFLRLDRAKHMRSSCSRDRPTLMLSRPQAADKDARQGFSEAGDPLWRNLRGVHVPRGRVNRVLVQPTRSH
jgi:hypothetical protein